MKKVYLAGQPSIYLDWKKDFLDIPDFEFFDPETDSDQSSPKTFFPDDLTAVSNADILIANP